MPDEVVDAPPAPRNGRMRVVVASVVVFVAAGAMLLERGMVPPAAVTRTQPAPAGGTTAVVPAASANTPLTTEFARLAPTPPRDAAGPSPPSAGSGMPAGDSAPASLEDVVSQVLPAVASIDAGGARGTGFFIKPDTVLTNAHVVGGEGSVQLRVGGTASTARVATVNAGIDVAVLRVVNANPQQATLSLGSLAGVRVGEEVVAVGSALGVLSNTVTRGIVSALRSAGPVTLIQTDAAINPGNSGGPLIDRAGRVIGINSIGVSKQAGEGLAFAVAIDHAAALLNGDAPSGTETPLGSLRDQMAGNPSASDRARAEGEERFAQTLQAAVRTADALDDYWNRYASSCVTASTHTGDRAWFAALEAAGVQLGRSPSWNCDEWLDRVRVNASELQVQIRSASESARQRGVYPGVLRDIRRRYRLEWAGWER